MKFIWTLFIGISLSLNVLWSWLAWVKVTESHWKTEMCHTRYTTLQKHMKVLLKQTEENRQGIQGIQAGFENINKDFLYLQDVSYNVQDRLFDLEEKEEQRTVKKK